jgi:leucine dehydrogenase
MPVDIFESMTRRHHEQVVFCYDQNTGLKAIIAVHDTTLGPALGGCRMWPYKSESDALDDVLRLSRGMTYKAAVAGLNLGGGKAVIIGDPKKDKSEALFRAFGRFVHSLGGRYITAEDVGTSVHDIEWARMETPYVTGIGRALGGSGDPSPMTAWGVYTGIKACTDWVFHSRDLSGLKVAIQGLGHTGYWLAKYLHDDGVQLFVTDIDEDLVKDVAAEFGAEAVTPDSIYDVDAEIFAPCALGGVVNDETLSRLKSRIVAGSANNVLAEEERHGPMLRKQGILYAPDFVINSGGLINVANELEGYNQERAKRQIEKIFDVLKEIFEITKRDDIPTSLAANLVAEQRIERMAKVKRSWVGPQEGMHPRRRGD